MSNKLAFWTGILGVIFFGVSSFLGGFQFDHYDPVSQYISETMAIGTPYGKILRFFGYIPSGILITICCLAALKKMPSSNLVNIGCWGLAIFYGMATIVVGLFPCDEGCNRELVDPSISQIIHNLTGLLTYLFVPVSILMIGIGMKKTDKSSQLSNIALICGLVSIAFVGKLLSDPMTKYAGLYQRIIEGNFMLWIIFCSIYIKKGGYSK